LGLFAEHIIPAFRRAGALAPPRHAGVEIEAYGVRQDEQAGLSGAGLGRPGARISPANSLPATMLVAEIRA
jgi:hypothetical protein